MSLTPNWSQTACGLLILVGVFLAVDGSVYDYDFTSYDGTPRNYSESCSTNSECNVAKELFCDSRSRTCRCVPNTVYDSQLKTCTIMRCNSMFNSCPNGMKCFLDRCTQHCDTMNHDCNPEPYTVWHTNEDFVYGLIALGSIALAILLITVLVCCVRRCKKHNERYATHQPLINGNMSEDDDDLLRGDNDNKQSSNVYSFFLCFTGQTPQ